MTEMATPIPVPVPVPVASPFYNLPNSFPASRTTTHTLPTPAFPSGRLHKARGAQAPGTLSLNSPSPERIPLGPPFEPHSPSKKSRHRRGPSHSNSNSLPQWDEEFDMELSFSYSASASYASSSEDDSELPPTPLTQGYSPSPFFSTTKIGVPSYPYQYPFGSTPSTPPNSHTPPHHHHQGYATSLPHSSGAHFSTHPVNNLTPPFTPPRPYHSQSSTPAPTSSFAQSIPRTPTRPSHVRSPSAPSFPLSHSYDTKFAGSAWQNSPPPAGLPKPKFLG